MIESIYDIDILGTIDNQGNIKELYNKEAVENSILVWLTSYNTDVIRNPGSGGYLTSYLSKPMSPENQQYIYQSLIDGFNQDYNLQVKILAIKINPDYVNKTWAIYIEAYVTEIKDTVTVSAIINNLV